MALDTPACCRCEGRCCGGPHSCPWGGGETPGPISSGCWVGPGGNRERPCVYITLQFVVRAMLTTMKQLVSNYIVHLFHHYSTIIII